MKSLTVAAMMMVIVMGIMIEKTEAAKVVVFGDSWGSFSRDEFENMFTSRGYPQITVDNQAIGGTTAAFWATMPNSLANAVSDNPDAEWVWLSIGGNDGIYGLTLGKPIEEIVEQAINDTRKILDPLFAAYPTIKVVQFGYDIVNFEMSLVCTSLGRTLFPDCRRNDIACANNEMYNLQWAVEAISAYYKTHTAVDLRGTLQAAGNIPAPHPNDNYYSPEDLMRDCIHPNSEGFDHLFDALWEVYFKAEVEGRFQKVVAN